MIRPVEPHRIIDFSPLPTGAAASEVTLGEDSFNQAYGVHELRTGTTPQGDRCVWKHNSLFFTQFHLGTRLEPIFPQEPHNSDTREILAAHIVTDVFGLSGLEYREGYWTDDAGHRNTGVIAPLVDGLRTLQDSSVHDIRNPDEAVAINVVRAWMGDWDSIKNDSNAFLLQDGTFVGGDYGWAFRDRIRDARVPFGNEKVLRALATPENVQPVVDRICALSDGDIRGMVDHIGKKYISDWTDHQATYFSGFLIRNRDRLKQENPFFNYQQGSVKQPPWLRWNLAGFDGRYTAIAARNTFDMTRVRGHQLVDDLADCLKAWPSHIRMLAGGPPAPRP